MTAAAKERDRRGAWRRLREDPAYVADWRANAGPTVLEAPPWRFRRQTGADLKAAAWNLLAWENPRYPGPAQLFRADAPRVEARAAVRPGRGGQTLVGLVLRAGARFTGLRLLDGTLVLKVSRGRRSVQIAVIDGDGFHPAQHGLDIAARKAGRAPGRWVRLKSLDTVIAPRR